MASKAAESLDTCSATVYSVFETGCVARSKRSSTESGRRPWWVLLKKGKKNGTRIQEHQKRRKRRRRFSFTWWDRYSYNILKLIGQLPSVRRLLQPRNICWCNKTISTTRVLCTAVIRILWKTAYRSVRILFCKFQPVQIFCHTFWVGC